MIMNVEPARATSQNLISPFKNWKKEFWEDGPVVKIFVTQARRLELGTPSTHLKAGHSTQACDPSVEEMGMGSQGCLASQSL